MTKGSNSFPGKKRQILSFGWPVCDSPSPPSTHKSSDPISTQSPPGVSLAQHQGRSTVSIQGQPQKGRLPSVELAWLWLFQNSLEGCSFWEEETKRGRIEYRQKWKHCPVTRTKMKTLENKSFFKTLQYVRSGPESLTRHRGLFDEVLVVGKQLCRLF